MARRKFSLEFKRSAVAMVTQQGVPVAKVAHDLGVDPGSIRDWIAKLGVEAGLTPSGDGALLAEVQRLRKENVRLTMERDILKKAAAFFAREQQ
jgi:transposase